MARSHIYVRPLRGGDNQDEFAFVKATENSGLFFPKLLFSLPTTKLMIAESAGRVVAYQPTYASLVMGSMVAVSQSDTELASAMHQFTAAAYTRANSEGFADILAFTSTPETESFAARHSFVPTHNALRMEVR